MRFKEVISRVTGLSCPIFGVSWSPPEPDIAVARRVITFLEDRRVLYNPSQMEVPEWCARSVVEIREYLTGELQRNNGSSELVDSLRAMRLACRKFMDNVGNNDDILRHGSQLGHWASWEFNSAVGELRGVFGIHVAQLATSFGLDVEDDLASILPASDVE